VPFLDAIEKLAEKVAVKAEVSFVEVAGDNLSLIVEMKASGSFENVYRFITLLENSPYNLEFVSANIQNANALTASADKNKKVPEWAATFQMKLLSFTNQ